MQGGKVSISSGGMRAETSASLWQQSCPLLGTSYCKTKAFPAAFQHKHTRYHRHGSTVVCIQLTAEFPEHSESTELKMMWVCAMGVMAGMFLRDHACRAGEPIFVKTCSDFPAGDTLAQGCSVAVPRAVLAL